MGRVETHSQVPDKKSTASFPTLLIVGKQLWFSAGKKWSEREWSVCEHASNAEQNKDKIFLLSYFHLSLQKRNR